MKIIPGGVTKAKGYKANGLYCGIKKSGKLDLALIASDVVANCAGVFTQNSVKAAPLLVSQKHIQQGKIKAIITNSGNANCFTGKKGFSVANQTTEIIGKLLNVPKHQVVVSSTGIIGRPLPVEKIQKAAFELVKGLSVSGAHKAALGILTTDTRTKEMAVEITLEGKKVVVGACAKGSGMTAPNMATMLAFVTTDAAIALPLLRLALKKAVDDTFNSISIDGCMSTNDMVVVLANGMAGNRIISKQNKDFEKFYQALHSVCQSLAKQIVLDAEGATKFIEIKVEGAETLKQARQVGLVIANSNLVKTAAFGSNPNWGRVAAAVGSMGIKKLTEEKLKIKFSPFDKHHITITVNLNIGQQKATIYSSDLSYEYVRINGEYN
jgi:glutamate N-acetyltransferase/amino-acid N-acetyltransferase